MKGIKPDRHRHPGFGEKMAAAVKKRRDCYRKPEGMSVLSAGNSPGSWHGQHHEKGSGNRQLQHHR